MRVFGGPGQNRGLVESEKWVFVRRVRTACSWPKRPSGHPHNANPREAPTRPRTLAVLQL